MAMTANFLARLAKGETPIPLLLWTIDGTTYLFSMGPISSDTYGPAYNRILEWSNFANGSGGLVNPRLESVRGALSIADPDAMLSTIIVGRSGDVRGSAAVVLWGFPDLATADWYTYFTGEVEKVGYSQQTWVFKLRTKDQVLKGTSALPYVTADVFPTAADGSLGKKIPVIYGLHDSTNLGVAGMLPTVHCSTNGDPGSGIGGFNHRYLMGLARMSDYGGTLRACNVDGVSPGAYGVDWNVIWSIRKGHWFTEVGFPVDPTPSVGVTVDYGGVSNVGAGSHSIADFMWCPLRQIVNYLTNFAFNSWDGDIHSGDGAGGWYTPGTDSPINTTAESALHGWLHPKGHRGSKQIVRETAEKTLNHWLDNLQLSAWWDGDGNLEFGVNDPHSLDVYLEDETHRHWLEEKDFLSEPNVDWDPTLRLREVAAQYLYATEENDFKRAMRAINWLDTIGAVDSMDLHWREAQE